MNYTQMSMDVIRNQSVVLAQYQHSCCQISKGGGGSRRRVQQQIPTPRHGAVDVDVIRAHQRGLASSRAKLQLINRRRLRLNNRSQSIPTLVWPYCVESCGAMFGSHSQTGSLQETHKFKLLRRKSPLSKLYHLIRQATPAQLQNNSRIP